MEKKLKKVTIEWRHYDKEGQTCDRCASTGTSVMEVIPKLNAEFADKDITFSLIETLLSVEDMSQSNIILLNGIPIEDLLDNAEAAENCCESCSCLTGEETSCRTVVVDGELHDDIPSELIIKAAYKAVEMMKG